MALFKALLRLSALLGKELREVFRRPGAILSLVLGPLVIMALFGSAYTGYRKPFDTVVVLPQNSGLPSDLAFYSPFAQFGVNVVEVTADADSARERLRTHAIHLVVVAPAQLQENFLAGRRSVLHVEWNELDPVADSLATAAAQAAVRELNVALIREAAKQGVSAARTNAGVVTPLSGDLIAEPAKVETANLAPAKPEVTRFYAPAVLALVLQHLAITLTALSVIRERTSGAIDLLRIAPVSATEILVSKYAAYGALCLLVAGAIVATLVGFFAVPLMGGWVAVGEVVVVLAFASLGVGLVISLVSDSERQAVQLSMLVLLASMFFSGFLLPISEFRSAAQVLSYALPVTYGIELLRDVMLQGTLGPAWHLSVLAAIALALFLLALWRLRATLRTS